MVRTSACERSCANAVVGVVGSRKTSTSAKYRSHSARQSSRWRFRACQSAKVLRAPAPTAGGRPGSIARMAGRASSGVML